ncbi:unnamed protein product, partial [Rhizoctonia solani]
MECIPSSEVLSQFSDQFNYCASPVCLSTGDVVGLSFTVQVGFVSALSVVSLLGYVAINYISITRNPAKPPRRLVRTNIDGLMLNLLIADLIMSFGAIINIHWASKAQVSCGQVCNAQGAIQILGETAVALFTLAITLLTFISIVRGWAVKARVWVWGSIVFGVWAFGALWAGVGGALEGFYAPTPYWCWISANYNAHRIGAEYVWLWISGFGSVLLYTPLFLLLRGNIKWDPEVGWASLAWSWRGNNVLGSNTLLWYPLAYTITILPVSIVRWIMFSGGQVSAAASFVAVSIFNLSGVVNVGLILLTRTNVLGLDYQAKEGAESRSVGDLLSGEDSVEGDLTGFGGVRVSVAAGMPIASTSKPGFSRIPKAGGSRIPTVGGSRVPSLGGRNAMSEKGPAGEKQELSMGKKRGLVMQKESPNPKARKILRTANPPPAATLKPNDGTKPTQPAAKKRALGSPPTSARKRQRLDLPLRSSERMNDPLDVIPPSSPRISRAESSVRVPSPTPPPPRAQERARSTTAFNIPLGDQSSLLGGAAMDISSAGLYSDFDNGETPSPKLTSVAHGRQTVNNTRRQSTNSTRRSSLTPKPRRRSATPRRSPKSTRQPSATPRRYEPKALPPPIVTPTVMQAKKEARLAEAKAKLATARSEAEAGLASKQTMTASQARLAAAQAEAERRLRMSVESGDNEGLSVVQEESYVEEESDRDDPLGEEHDEETEVERGQEEEGEEQGEDEDDEDGEGLGEDEDTLQPLRDEDEGLPEIDEIGSSQTQTPKASTSTTPRAQSRGTATPAFRPTATPATRSTTTPAYKPTTTPATVKPATTTPATSFKRKSKSATFQDTPDPTNSDTPSEYAPDEHENTKDIRFYQRRPSLGFSLSQLSLGTPSKEKIKEILRDEGEIASRTRSRRASGDGTRRESLAGAMNGLKLNDRGRNLSMGVMDEGEGTGEMEEEEEEEEEAEEETEVEQEEEEGDETVRRATTTPRAPGPSYSTTPRNLPSTTPRARPLKTPGNTSTTPRTGPSMAGPSTTPFYLPSTTPGGDPSHTKRKPRKSGSPTQMRGRGKERGRGPGGAVSPTRNGEISRTNEVSPGRGRSSSGRRGNTSPARGESSSRGGDGQWWEHDFVSQTEGLGASTKNWTVKPKSPMKVEVVIPRPPTKSVSKTPVFKPAASASSFKPTASVSSFQPSASMGSSKPASLASQHSGSTLSSRIRSSTSSLNPTTSTSASRYSASTSASVFNSPSKVTLQQPTPELSSLDRSPGSHQDTVASATVSSQQDVGHIDEGGHMSVSLGSQDESIGSQHESTGSGQDTTGSVDSQRDQDMDYTDEVPETSLPNTPAEQRETTKLPSQSSFSHLLDRDMVMRSERIATLRMETSQRNMTVHADVSQRSTTLSRSASAKSHTPVTKKPIPKKTPGLKILPESQVSRLNAFTPRVPSAPADDSVEFTPASRFDFNESHMDFEDTPAKGSKFVQSTPFVRNGARPSLGLGTFQDLHLGDSMDNDDEIPDSQADLSDHDSQ